VSDSPAEGPIYEPCEGCRELLDVTSFSPFETAICPLCSVETHVKRTFGTYQLEQRYAIGGMSVIFVGRDTTLDRKIAIKVLNEEYCNDEVRIQAFENEARLTAQVSHPNVVKVYAVGRAYGRFYLVMELLEGRSFEHIMQKRGALPEDEVLEIATQVAAGLQAAKNAGMIHRDVKPGNILIDSEGHARLVDFGLALITQDGSAQAEEVWATPFYVPPEALERGIEDFRSDIYAFGATLYHALAGRPPFDTTSTSNSVLRRAKQTIPRLCKVAEWVSPGTGDVIDRMMAFKPEHRWKSYSDVIRALENARRNIGQAPSTPVLRSTRSSRRKSGNGFAFVIGIIALAAALALWQPWKSGKANTDIPPTSENDKSQANHFDPNADQSEKITKSWQSARDLVTDGDFKHAAQAFDSLAQNTNLPKPSRGWAALEGATSALLNGRPAEGRRLATQTLANLKGADSQNTNVLELRRFAQILRRIPPPSLSDVPQKPKTIVAAMGSFALALKMWEQSQWQTALPIFAKVRSASLPDNFRWFKHYQTIADTYLADGQILSKLKELPEPKNTDEASAQIGALADAVKSLRTNGRARYNLRARQAYLARRRKSFQQGPVISDSSLWHEVLPILTDHGKACRFSEITAILADPPSGAPTNAIWAWQYLQKEAAAFLADLATQTDWSAAKKDGTEVTPESGNTEGLLLPDKSLVPWSELKPERLIEEHTGSETQAIAFAHLTGLTTLAEEKAEDLAGRDANFRRDWRRVIVGTSQ
jgi:serine/threonine protein kinase